MIVKLIINDNVAEIVLMDSNKKELDKIVWDEHHDFLEKFFVNLNKIMDRNNVSINDIESFSLENNIPDKYTTVRIADTIVDVMNFALNKMHK